MTMNNEKDLYIEYLAHMLDESMKNKCIVEDSDKSDNDENKKSEHDKDDSKKKSSNDNQKKSSEVKDPKGKIEAGLKGMKPGAVMQAIAKSLGTTSPDFLKKHLLKLVINAAKNGTVKAAAIKDAIKDFGNKNVEDNSKIDWEHVEIDPSGTTMKCMFDGESKKKIDELAKVMEKEMQGVEKEIEEADKKLHDDVKKAGVDIDDEKLDQNGIVVASVIDDKENKKLKGKELTKKVDDAIEKDENVKKLIKKTKNSKKALKKVKIDAKYDKMSDDELEKKMKELEEEMKKRKWKKEDKKKSLKKKDDGEKKSKKSSKKDNEKVEENKVNESVLNENKPSTKDAFAMLAKFIEKHPDDESLQRCFRNKSFPSGVMKSLLKQNNFKMSDMQLNAFIHKLESMTRRNMGGFTKENFDDFLDNMKIDSSDASNFVAKAIDWKDPDYVGVGQAADVDSSKDILKNIDSEESAQDAVKKLVKAGKSAEEAQEEVMSKIKGADWYKDLDGDAKDELTDKLSLEADSVSSGVDADLDAADIPDGPTDNFGKVPTGFAVMPDGSKVPSFSYSSMSRQISDLDDIFDDGKVTPEELAKLNGMASKLDSYVEWAAENKDSNDPNVQMKIATIKRLTSKYNDLVDNNASNLNSNTDYFNSEQGAARLSLPKDANGKAIAATAKSEEAQKAAGGWKKALGLDKAFTALGVARLAAKTTGVILNNGKTVVDVLGAQAMKFKEDKNIIAKMNCLLTNGEGSKSKFEDTKFSVRFDIGDFKWHATCLDNRKMKFPEDKLINAVFNTDEGKKFKKACIAKWRAIFRPKDEKRAFIPYMLANADKVGLKIDGIDKDLLDVIRKMNKNFGKIETAFKD